MKDDDDYNIDYGSVVEGVVTEKQSNLLYEVQCLDGQILVVSLGKNLISGAKLSIGAKVFVQLLPRPNNHGRILNAVDFKSHGWKGWTDEHEPKLK